MIVALLFSTFAEGLVAPRTSLLQLPTFASWRDLRWLLPLVFPGNVVVATNAWVIVGLVIR
jgi:hypothetical protein